MVNFAFVIERIIMSEIYLVFVVFLFVLAVFDLSLIHI